MCFHEGKELRTFGVFIARTNTKSSDVSGCLNPPLSPWKPWFLPGVPPGPPGLVKAKARAGTSNRLPLLPGHPQKDVSGVSAGPEGVAYSLPSGSEPVQPQRRHQWSPRRLELPVIISAFMSMRCRNPTTKIKIPI